MEISDPNSDDDYDEKDPTTPTLFTTGNMTFAQHLIISCPDGAHINTGSFSAIVDGPIDGSGLMYKDGGGTLKSASVNLDAMNIQAGTVQIALNGSNTGLSTIGTLTFATGATLDLVDNDLIVHNSNYSAIAGKIASARNGGSWNGAGITSSVALSSGTVNTLGTMTGSEYLAKYGGTATFNGSAVSSGDVLVKYTYYGDADLNGQVNYDDYAKIDAGFSNSRTGWFNGDFDYNGVVNFDDYALIDRGFLNQGGVLTGGPDGNPLLIELGQMPHFMYDGFMEYFIDWSAARGDFYTEEDFYPFGGRPGTIPPPGPVPEPATFSLVAVAVTATTMRRRHRRA
jgi:hypothetical protein